MNQEIITKRLEESIRAHKRLLENDTQINQISILADKMTKVINNGGKILLCGNGGSASDALHIAGELVGRFQKERKAFSAIALNSDVATMTAIANDYGFEEVFSRQVQGLMRKDDLLIGISTSGNSKNVINAFNKASEIGGLTVALTGKTGGALKELADIAITVPEEVTARIQECHMCIYHVLCEIVELNLVEKSNK